MSHHDDTIRAWKDREFRDTLSGTSLLALPAHPAGEIDAPIGPLDPVAGGASTEYLLTLGCCQGVTAVCNGFTDAGGVIYCTVMCLTILMTTRTMCKT
jgi:mersacidin/lichenicidin family type 2 lantibiotic